MYQTLYRKYRPSNLDEVIGQSVIVKTLKNAILKDQLSHAYLFTGPRGTGKTSVAKILARTINCVNLEGTNPCNKCINCIQNLTESIDIIEIDAASNNGVDEIRELKSKINLVPSNNKYKVYIIDEVHMLTTGAFNALLKTLEEPPNHVLFILATTEPHKIPITILSRCQRFDFQKISISNIVFGLEYISKQEKIDISNNCLKEIARISNGGMRDAIGLLDQVNAYADGQIKVKDIYEINGSLSFLEIKEFIEQINIQNLEKLMILIDTYNEKGKDFIKLTEEILYYLRNLLLKNQVPNYFSSLHLDEQEYNLTIEFQQLIIYINYFNEVLINLKKVVNPRLLFELNIIKIINNIKTASDHIKKNEITDHDKIIKESSLKKIDLKALKEIKNIRINNTLCNFNKNIFNEIKNKLDKVHELIIHPKYKKYASIVLDGTIKAASNDHLIFVYESEYGNNTYNENLKEIDEMFKFLFQSSFKSIAVTNQEWKIIRDEFNNKKRKYQSMIEPDELINQLTIKKDSNDIEEVFGNIVEYN